MTSVKSHPCLTAGTVTVRRKPAFTYQSPTQNTAVLHPESSHFVLPGATILPRPSSPPSRLSEMPELSQRSTVTHRPSHQPMITPLLPLYHPLGTLALSLPDLDPTVFGLPAPVAVFDDPTRRSSHRQRRPTAKVRDADELATSQLPSSVAVTAMPDSETRERTSPRRRRGGGPGGRRRRREPEDGDATYPAKRPRNARSSGVSSGLAGTRALSREEGSPTLSNAHSGASPALEGGQSEVVEEKKAERRTTRSRRVVARQDSTASDETATSASPSVSATNGTVPRVVSSGEPMETEEPIVKGASNEDGASRAEAKKTDADDVSALEQQDNVST